ncbi:MAG TPA: phytoene/squalene synthase family protein [Desulfobacterales bacterium]
MNVNTAVAILQNTQTQSRARRSLARHGKSFHWAARAFSAPMAEEVATLYAFCRTVDDTGDTLSPQTARRKLATIRSDLKTASSDIAEVQTFIELAFRRGIDLRLPRLLVDAVASDLTSVRMGSWNELIRYAYGVASTVGLMMCPIMNVRNPAAHPFAVDLGIAMQLTNIARDVVEDARRDRIYLPRQVLGEPYEPDAILDGNAAVRKSIARARQRLLHRAVTYYRSADAGMRFIPLRQRLAVMTAARLYEAIGARVLDSSTPWYSRAFVDKRGKMLQTLRAVAVLLGNPKYWPAGRYPRHDPTLHRALAGLPGTHGGL